MREFCGKIKKKVRFWGVNVQSRSNFNLMYYYVEGELRDIPVDIPIPHSIKASLMATITDVLLLTTTDRDMARKACARFRGRIEAVIEANGDFIE